MACAAAIFQVLEQVSFGSLLSDIVIAKHHWLDDLNKVSCLSVCISVCLSGWLAVSFKSIGRWQYYLPKTIARTVCNVTQ